MNTRNKKQNLDFGDIEETNDSHYQKIPTIGTELDDFSLKGVKMDSTDSLYDALDNKGLLKRPSFPEGWGLHLVKQGEVGLLMDNGKPVFLTPGRYTFKSPLKKYHGTRSVSHPLIELGPVQIVTIKKGEIGLSTRNGENIILEPGRYILQAPHVFEKSAKVNEAYVQLGTHHRLTVKPGFVAIATVDGSQIIISQNDEATKKPFIIDSETFSFDPKTGFQRIMKQNVELEPLMVSTTEGVQIKVEGIISYKISDAKKAFLEGYDVHGSIKRLAEATLTGVFANLSLGEIASSLSTAQTIALHDKGKEKDGDVQNDLLHKATSTFLNEFQKIALEWGVDLLDLKIEKMEWEKKFSDVLRDRTEKSLTTATNLLNVGAKNQVEISESERKAQQRRIEAEGEAEAIITMAEARRKAAGLDTEGAKALASEPVAVALAMKKADAEIIGRVGNNAIYIPTDFGMYGLNRGQGPMFFARQNVAPPPQTLGNDQVVMQQSVMGMNNGSSG